MSSMEVSNLTKENLKKMFSENKRTDGRTLLDLRDVDISFDVSNMAEGSARVKLGKTEVIVGVKMSIGTPYPDSPEEGNLMVSSDLLPMASPRFEHGPPTFNAIELGRLVDRGLRESGLIDFSGLCIESGEKVWTVFVDVYPINDDGNLIDASALGAVAALRKAKIPGIDENGNPDYKHRTDKSLPLSEEISPLVFSFFKLGDSLILDPTREEQEACESRTTFGISKWNGQFMINSGQKIGTKPVSREELEKISEVLKEKYEEVEKKLKSSLK